MTRATAGARPLGLGAGRSDLDSAHMEVGTGLVGREAERARLSQVVAAAGDGAGSLVLLSGEAGIGKSRLADEVAAGSAALVLRGAGSNSAPTPYGPIVGALRSHL